MLTTIAGILYGSVAVTCALGLTRAARASDDALAEHEAGLARQVVPDPRDDPEEGGIVSPTPRGNPVPPEPAYAA